jgi:hypothetical protein
MAKLLMSLLFVGGMMDSHVEGALGQLPVEPASTSEILSATHIFTVAIVGRTEQAWTAGAGGISQRRVQLQLDLAEVLKGRLNAAAGSKFSLEVVQKGVSPFVQMDYMGLWSHADTDAGVRYLIVAKGSSQSPADLMQEGPIERLFPAALAADVRAAAAAEQTRDPLRLLQFAGGQSAKLDELFGRYVWARLMPAFLKQYQSLLEPVLSLLKDTKANSGFRREIVEGLDDAVTKLGSPLELIVPVARAYFGLLSRSETESLHDDLVDVHIFNLLFIDEKKPRIDSNRVISNAAERRSFASILQNFDTERSSQLRRWLGSQ